MEKLMEFPLVFGPMESYGFHGATHGPMNFHWAKIQWEFHGYRPMGTHGSWGFIGPKTNEILIGFGPWDPMGFHGVIKEPIDFIGPKTKGHELMGTMGL
jgi:hypothetical protein